MPTPAQHGGFWRNDKIGKEIIGTEIDSNQILFRLRTGDCNILFEVYDRSPITVIHWVKTLGDAYDAIMTILASLIGENSANISRLPRHKWRVAVFEPEIVGKIQVCRRNSFGF